MHSEHTCSCGTYRRVQRALTNLVTGGLQPLSSKFLTGVRRTVYLPCLVAVQCAIHELHMYKWFLECRLNANMVQFNIPAHYNNSSLAMRYSVHIPLQDFICTFTLNWNGTYMQATFTQKCHATKWILKQTFTLCLQNSQCIHCMYMYSVGDESVLRATCRYPLWYTFMFVCNCVVSM